MANGPTRADAYQKTRHLSALEKKGDAQLLRMAKANGSVAQKY
jgi:hypothetical protein